MQITAYQIAQIIDGKVDGDGEVLVDRPSKIEEGGPGSLTFLANPKYESFAYSTTASVLLVPADFQPAEAVSATLIRVPNVYEAVARLFELFQDALTPKNFEVDTLAAIHETVELADQVGVGAFSVLEKGVRVGTGTRIYPQVYIGPDVKIGKNVTIYPGVRIYRACEIGDGCTIHSNAVIGSDGFGFAPTANGDYQKIQQLGNVVLEENVEIGANTVIDRATMGSTRICKGAKLDNLIQIAHNVEIGENTVMAAQAGVAGSTRIGKNAQIGGQAGFVGHIEVA
ncbi:MAG: UDP-3-O-(3-hydroxymyristoyl)glucosamine N-acyltransferase, partial [Phaeodactylibacter sp.]|nr:UDP-3-O-(3-hydroxymyristoyl)glucosamine N-acyltransferase [Phaeodactylibacter sp.]